MRAMILAAAFALAACGPINMAGPPAENAAEAAAPATPSGPPVQVPLLDGEHPEASVAQVALLESGGKVYSTVGGDPAINGHYTFITRYAEAPDTSWRVFQIGDFNSWSVTEDRGNEIVLNVSRSWIGDDGEIQTADERYIVSVPDGDDTSITITPAN